MWFLEAACRHGAGKKTPHSSPLRCPMNVVIDLKRGEKSIRHIWMDAGSDKSEVEVPDRLVRDLAAQIQPRGLQASEHQVVRPE